MTRPAGLGGGVPGERWVPEFLGWGWGVFLVTPSRDYPRGLQHPEGLTQREADLPPPHALLQRVNMKLASRGGEGV